MSPTADNLWSPERDQLLKDLWADGGMSMTGIAKIMEVSRGAVAGRKNRLGLPKRAVPKNLERPKQRPIRTAPASRPDRRPYELRNDPPPRGRCPWIEGDPRGDPANAFYCCEEVMTSATGERSIYCVEHHGKAYLTQQQAAARARRIKRRLKRGKSTIGM